MVIFSKIPAYVDLDAKPHCFDEYANVRCFYYKNGRCFKRLAKACRRSPNAPWIYVKQIRVTIKPVQRYGQ